MVGTLVRAAHILRQLINAPEETDRDGRDRHEEFLLLLHIKNIPTNKLFIAHPEWKCIHDKCNWFRKNEIAYLDIDSIEFHWNAINLSTKSDV